MSMYCELSNSRLGLLYVAAMVLGADLILLCWRFLDGQSGWIPAFGGGRNALCLVQCFALSKETRGYGIRGYG